MDFALFLLIILAFYNSGKFFTQKLWNLQFTSPGEAFLFPVALGTLIISGITTALLFLGEIKPATCQVVLGVLLVLGWKNLWHLKNTVADWHFFNRHESLEVADARLKTIAQSFLGLFALLALSLALAPAFATDALVYHLAVPKAFLQTGGLINLPNNIYSFYPQHMEMLYLFGLALGSDSLAQLTGLGIVLLLLIALYQYYRQQKGAYAWLVPLLFISTPAFFTVAYSAYVDLQTAAYLFLSFYAWENWRTRKQTGWFYLMTLFVGAAIATKLTAIIALPMALLGIALAGKTQPKKVLGQCFVLLLGVLLLTLPWWGRNYFFTGNPLAPFFIQFFGGEQGMNWDITRSLQQLQYYTSYGMGHGILDFLLLPVNLTFFGQTHSLKFDGQIGILYFLLLPALLGLRRQSMPMIITFLIFMIFWFTQTQQARLLATPFAFLAILSVQGLEGWLTSHSEKIGENGKTVLFAILLLGLLFNTSLITKAWAQVRPLPYILQKENRDQFLTRQIRAYPLYRTANEFMGEKEKILLVYVQNMGYLMDRPFFSDSIFEAHSLKKIIDEEVYAEGIIIKLKSMGITHILFNHNYILGENAALSMGEKAILKNFLLLHAQRIQAKNGFLLYRFVLN